MRWLSLKTKVALMATAMLLIVLSALCVVQLSLVRSHMMELLKANELTVASSVANEIDDKLSLSLNALASTAAGIHPDSEADLVKLQDLVDRRPGLDGLFDAMAVVKLDGGFATEFTEKHGSFSINVADRPWFHDVMESKKPVISAPIRGRLDNGPMVVLAAPIKDQKGAVVGVLCGSLMLFRPNFLGRISMATVGKTGAFGLFSRDRTIIIAHDERRTMSQGSPPGVSPFFDRALKGGEGVEESTNSQGIPALYAYKTLTSVPWVLMAKLPMAEALEPIRAAQYQTLLLVILVAVLAMPIVWFSARHLLFPLVQLHDAIRTARKHPGAVVEVKTTSNDEIGQLASDFNALVKERAHADEQVRVRTHELEQSNKDLDAFSYTVAHDLRAPIRHISAYASELRHALAAGEKEDIAIFLDRIAAAARRQGEMVDGLLNYASLQQEHLNVVSVDIKRLVHRLLDEVKAEAKPGTLWDVGELPVVKGDETLLAQLFSNLIENAVKYSSKQDRPEIRIGWCKEACPLGKIFVSDNGAGFDPRYADKLFGVFQRLHSASEFPGTGIGLASVRRIAERLGGTVAAKGKPGHGATFEVMLALA